jgi:hypothetical protein
VRVILDLLNLALLAACTIVLVLMFQAYRVRASALPTTLAKFRLLSKLCCGVAIGWIALILLGDKSVFLNGICALMYGWLSYSFRQNAQQIEAVLEAASKQQADEQAEKPDCQPPGS